MSSRDPQETREQILDFCAEARVLFAGRTQPEFAADLCSSAPASA